MLWITPAGDAADRFEAEIRTEPAIVSTVTVQGELRSSLWEAVLDTGEQPELVMLIADIFGWDLDFNTEPRVGDTFRVAFEKKEYADGSVAYAQVFAAEYVNQGRAYQAVLFRDPNGRPAFYAPDGSSLQKMFLRSPLVFGGRISSRFSRARMHPILKRVRPHLGIDYAAPTGSPVQAIGSGRVLFAGRKRGEGNTVHVRHSNGYETMYLHLSRMLVRAGQHVDQGQRIGLVGSTGLSTAPHLDFRITQNGKYRNFEALHLPPATPVAKKDWSEFAKARDEYLAMLPTANPQGMQKAAARPAGERTPTTSGQ
jgi:murein DD-endopeptidase MepM/ murein hydrolase activator NlpD